MVPSAARVLLLKNSNAAAATFLERFIFDHIKTNTLILMPLLPHQYVFLCKKKHISANFFKLFAIDHTRQYLQKHALHSRNLVCNAKSYLPPSGPFFSRHPVPLWGAFQRPKTQ